MLKFSQMRRKILLFILFIFFVGHTMAQQNAKAVNPIISVSTTGSGHVYYANQNEPPRALEFNDKSVPTSAFLNSINQYFNIPADFSFVEAESNNDNIGMRHHLMKQYYKSVEIEGMCYRVHEKDGFVRSANGKAVKKVILNTIVNISEEQAFQLAVKYLDTKDTVFRHGKKLIVSKDFTFTPESFSIAYQFDIAVSMVERWRISIDAATGQLINKVSLVNSCFKEKNPPTNGRGTGLTSYYGNQSVVANKAENDRLQLMGQNEHGGRFLTFSFHNASVFDLLGRMAPWYDIYSSDSEGVFYDKPGVSVQWAVEQVYEYYFNKHNRNSYDNNGGMIISLVHVGNNYDNAFWDGDILAFGDGSSHPLVELDVVSHELTHAVTQYEAALYYINESGALNESFSDILGKAVEFDKFGDTATWQLARHFQDGGLRDLSNPNLKNQPDTYHGNMWYAGSSDNGGVHYNSGVQNFWFYLLSEGGTGVNDHQVSYAVKSIGVDSAANIVYRNLTEYISPLSDYVDSRIGSLLATADLYGKNSAAFQEVIHAWNAVGVAADPVINSLAVYDITATTVKITGSFLQRRDTIAYHFEYGTTPALGSSSSINKDTNKIEGTVTGLQSATKYYLKVVATNESGTISASTEFNTISLAPLTKIKQTSDVAETTAILYGQVNPNSLPTSYYFEYGPTQAFGFVTPTYTLSDTTEFLNVSATIINLQPRKTYYYRIVARNGFASCVSESANIFTAVKPVISSYTPAAAAPGTEVSITGQNFNPAAEKNLVSFGATRAMVLSSSSTEIKVKVPIGASLGTISLLDSESGLAGESVQEFVPTFSEEFKKNDLKLKIGVNDLYIYQTVVEDMDGDGKPDIVARHYGGFVVLQNVNQGGDITDQSFVRTTLQTTEYIPEFFSLADLDGNGLKDIICIYGYGVRVYPNLSVPGYIFFGIPVDLNIPSPWSFTLNDFDRDGRIDVAAATYSGATGSVVDIYRNRNPKGFISSENFVKQFSLALPSNAFYLYNDDLNNDGKPDLLASTNNKTSLTVLKNNGLPGTFDFTEIIIQDSTGQYAPQYVSQDLNQDGWKDITSGSRDHIGDMVITENKGISTDVAMAKPNFVLSGYAESNVQPGDVDGDGKVDLLVSLHDRQFIFLKNKTTDGSHLSISSFEKLTTYGTPTPDGDYVDTNLTINDLNGDGRPEIIKINSYYYGPHDGYFMEIWQNSHNSCPDPSDVKVSRVSNSTATISLPANTTIDQFEIAYAPVGFNYWSQISSTTISYLGSGRSYQLRIRAKCFLNFTDYYYTTFTTDCVNTNDFSISNIKAHHVLLSAYSLYDLEIQYSPAGKNQWNVLPQYTNTINNLLPGTTYDLRYRGLCNSSSDFTYKQFTTLCPQLLSLSISNLSYNKASANWTSDYVNKVVAEYSEDNSAWTLIDETRTMYPLTPGKKYFVRASMACASIQSDFIYTSFTTPCPTVSMLNADAITPYDARIIWADESNTGIYTLNYAALTGGPTTTVETNSTSITLGKLTPGTQYTVGVAPQCIAAQTYTSTIFSTICYVPFNLSADNITNTSVELSWNDNFSGLPYYIDYSIEGSNVWRRAEATPTNIVLSALRPGSEYEARVHINCTSETPPYASLHFTTNLYNETAYAPNPADDKITIYPSKNLIGNYFSINDNAGKIIISGQLLDYTIDLSDFSAGIYTLKIEGEEPVKILKR
jgi:Zn-dependent metalloprotease